MLVSAQRCLFMKCFKCLSAVSYRVSSMTFFEGSTGAQGVSGVVGSTGATGSTGSNGATAQGVQHTYEIKPIGVIGIGIDNSISVFPNPTGENLTLQKSDYDNEKMSYQLVNTQGHLVSNGLVTTSQTQINTADLPASTYFIHIINHNNEKIKILKIIKKNN